MTSAATAALLVDDRVDVVRSDDLLDPATLGVVEKPLTIAERVWNIDGVRKASVVLALLAAWQIYAAYLGNELLFPTLAATVGAFAEGIASGVLPERMANSVKLLIMGYASGVLLAGFFTVLAVSTRIGTDFLETVTAAFSPLPAIALLPLSLLWFGLGDTSIVFVLIHSVLWPVALNMHAGFRAVSPTLRMVGGNYGLKAFPLVASILIPAGFPAILTGLKIGWAFAWRTLIAAELVFGATSGSGGLGWFIYESKNSLDIPSVFAGLFAVIVVGLLVEEVVFKTIERRTVIRWGMQR